MFTQNLLSPRTGAGRAIHVTTVAAAVALLATGCAAKGRPATVAPAPSPSAVVSEVPGPVVSGSSAGVGSVPELSGVVYFLDRLGSRGMVRWSPPSSPVTLPMKDVGSATVSPDGRRVALESQGALVIVNVDGSNERSIRGKLIAAGGRVRRSV